MQVNKISHVGIAVTDLDQQKLFYRDVLGLELLGEEEVADQRVKVAVFRAGQVRIELLEPTDPGSPIARFIDKRGQGIHHIAYEVDDLDGALAEMKQREIRLIDKQPRAGAEGQRIAFAHPKATFGVLTELCQPGENRQKSEE